MKSELFNFDTPHFGKVREWSTANVFSSSLSSCFCQAAFISGGQKFITHTLAGERIWSWVTVHLECAEAAPGVGAGGRWKTPPCLHDSAGLGLGPKPAFFTAMSFWCWWSRGDQLIVEQVLDPQAGRNPQGHLVWTALLQIQMLRLKEVKRKNHHWQRNPAG